MSWQKLQSNTAIILKNSEFLGQKYGEKKHMIFSSNQQKLIPPAKSILLSKVHLKKLTDAQLVKNFPAFMEPKCIHSSSQKHTVGCHTA
jgi:hypothetical protein